MYRKIYFMGIKGVGMASLAIIAKQAGFEVAGSDIADEFITDIELKNAGITPLVGFKEENVENFFGGTPPAQCLFIATGAHEGFENAESKVAYKKDIKVISHGQAVGLFMSGTLFERTDIEGISVSGSHGKTTISGMMATVLMESNLDPSFTVGSSEISPIGAAGHFGHGIYFVAEADEYVSEKTYDPVPKFYYQKPKALIINNVDFDHPDFYKDIDAVKNAYAEFASNLPDTGTLVVNGDDKNALDVLQKIGSKPRIITFGASDTNEFIIKDYKDAGWGSTFKVFRNGTEIGEFKLSVPGYYNAKNALSVITLLFELGIPAQKIASGLEKFKGVARRQEVVGQTKHGQMIVDDYAHHPEEIKKTLEAIKASTGKKIFLVYQFHTFSRTRALFSEFVGSMIGASEIIILSTFAAKRGEAEGEALDNQFVEELHKINLHANFVNSLENVVKYIDQNVQSSDFVIVTMGAGDVYKVGQLLTTQK